MEKIITALWAQGDRDRFNARLLADLPDKLRAAGASNIRINVRDEIVAPGEALVQRWQEPQQDAIVQYWLPSANALFRAGVDDALAACSARFASWLVAESTIIAAPRGMAGARSPGWSQASFISFRPDLPHAESINIWHSHHTRVAIDTQSNFEYVQNLVVRPLTNNAPDYDAFVEECFPLEALSDPFVFFDSKGDKARFDANLAKMMDSCQRFIQFGRIDIIPTSQYDFG